LTAVVLGVVTFGCGTPHATLDIAAPSSAVAGFPFTVTVTAIYEGGQDTVINSSIHFTSSDPSAVLPPDYYYTANDAGSHTFPNGVTLKTPGSQSITATVVGGPGINGTANVTVSAATTVAQ
jgi:adhesin/invasin